MSHSNVRAITHSKVCAMTHSNTCVMTESNVCAMTHSNVCVMTHSNVCVMTYSASFTTLDNGNSLKFAPRMLSGAEQLERRAQELLAAIQVCGDMSYLFAGHDTHVYHGLAVLSKKNIFDLRIVADPL